MENGRGFVEQEAGLVYRQRVMAKYLKPSDLTLNLNWHLSLNLYPLLSLRGGF